MDWSTIIPVIPWIFIVAFFIKSSRRTARSSLGKDEWVEVAKRLDGKSIALLSCTSRSFRSEMTDPSVWRFTFLKEFDVPDPGEVRTHWKAIYTSARRHTLHPRAYSRIGAIFMEGTNALLAKSAVQRKDKVIEVEDVQKGIWILDLMVLDHYNDPLNNNDHCYYRVLEARHAEVLLPDPGEEGWSWQAVGKHVVQLPTMESRLSIYDAKYFDSSETADLVQSEALWPKSECMGNEELMEARKLITAHGASAIISDVNHERLHRTCLSFLVRRSEDGKAIGLRILETMLSDLP